MDFWVMVSVPVWRWLAMDNKSMLPCYYVEKSDEVKECA